MNQIIFPLVLALAATLATTGCKHTPVKITQIPGATPRNPNDAGNPSTVGNGGTMGGDTGTGVNTQTGGGNTAGLDTFDGMIKDPAALAANTIHFAFDSAAIKQSEQSNLEAVASALKSNTSDKLLIEGNCDERGTEEYNRALGERRALAAREALAKLGVSPDRIRTISYGKDKPADPGHDESAWGKNRRADFILLHPKANA
ncbi:MAG TPA: peptidoglycan-associated lipoprotein Pal [Verrucomicrobiae bacterium]